MTITNQNVEIYRGDTEVIGVTLTDANGDPFAISPNGTIKYRVSQTDADDPEEYLIMKEFGGGVIMDGNVAEVTLLAEDTDLPPGFYYHEMKIFDLGDVSTAMTGTFQVRRSLRMMGVKYQAQAKLSPTIHLSGNTL